MLFRSRLFFFTLPETTRFITTRHDTPQGTSEQRWREWENGESPIPKSLIGQMKELNEWRSLALDATADNIRIQMREKGGGTESDLCHLVRHTRRLDDAAQA